MVNNHVMAVGMTAGMPCGDAALAEVAARRVRGGRARSRYGRCYLLYWCRYSQVDRVPGVEPYTALGKPLLVHMCRLRTRSPAQRTSITAALPVTQQPTDLAIR